jgi:hypothetical protein
MAYQLGIQENSIDSFNEEQAKYRKGEGGQVRAYKFAILHMAHFLELSARWSPGKPMMGAMSSAVSFVLGNTQWGGIIVKACPIIRSPLL